MSLASLRFDNTLGAISIGQSMHPALEGLLTIQPCTIFRANTDFNVRVRTSSRSTQMLMKSTAYSGFPLRSYINITKDILMIPYF